MKTADVKKALGALGYYNSNDFSSRESTEYDAAVRHFQQEHTDLKGVPLSVDGIPGPKTKGILKYFVDSGIDKIWSVRREDLVPQVKSFIHQSAEIFMIRENKGHSSTFDFNTVDRLPDGLYMLIKDKTPPNKYDRTYLRTFTGAGIVVLVEKGIPKIVGSPFRVSTAPGQKETTSSGTPVINGERAIAWLMPNVLYRFETRRSGSRKRFNPIDGVAPCWRDYQSKGWIDEEERKKTFAATMTQYHSDENKGVPISIGCIVSPQEDYDRVAGWIEKVAADKKFFTGVFRYF